LNNLALAAPSFFGGARVTGFVRGRARLPPDSCPPCAWSLLSYARWRALRDAAGADSYSDSADGQPCMPTQVRSRPAPFIRLR